jgi:hypothetical protein
MRTPAILALMVSCANAAPRAAFDADDLVIRDGRRSSRLKGLLDRHAFYATIHAVQQRGPDLFVVYGTSEMSKGWPPRNGHCGCGIESYVRWLHIREGGIIARQEGRQESCFMNRDGWSIAWRQGKLVWNTEGIERHGDPVTGRIVPVAFTWTFDPAHPEKGIAETRSLGKP